MASTIIVLSLGLRIVHNKNHQRAIHQLTGRGAYFFSDFEDPIGPNWMWTRDGLGRGALARNGLGWVVNSPLCTSGWRSVQFEAVEFDAQDRKCLNHLIGIQDVFLVDVPITRELLNALTQMAELTHLSIDSDLDDSHVPLLKQLNNLEYLTINSSHLTPEAIRELKAAFTDRVYVNP